MKSANGRENSQNKNIPMQRMPEGDALTRTMSPPPLALAESSGESSFEEEGGMSSTAPLQRQLQPDSTPGDDGNGDVTQLQEDPQLQQGTEAESGNQQIAQGEQDIQDQTVVLPGAFNIQDGPEAFHQYLLAPIRNAFTSNTFSVNLAFNINLGFKGSVLKGGLALGGGGVFGVEVNLNRQDDRLVRGGWNISYGGQFVSELLWFMEYTREWVGKSSHTSVFDDMTHFAAVCFDVLRKGYNTMAEYSDKVESIDFDESPAEGDINWGALAERDTTKINGTSFSDTQTLTASVPGMNTSASGSYSTTSSESNFYKSNGENTITKTSTQEDKSWSLGGEISGVGVEVAMTDTGISNHANSDNDGDYRNVNITFKNFPRMAKLMDGFGEDVQKVKSLIQSTQDPMGFAQLALGMCLGLVKSRLDLLNPVEMKSWQDFKGGFGGADTGLYSNSSFSAEFNFIRFGSVSEESGSWNLQYFRMSAGAEAGFKWDEEVPLATLYGVVDASMYSSGNVGAGVNAGMFEVLGDNTCSYVITVYNGLVYSQSEVDQGFATNRFDRWNDYRATHINGIKGIIMKLGDPTSVPYQEATGSYGLSTSDALIAEAQQSAQTGKVSDSALQLFENFLTRNYDAKAASDNAVAGTSGELAAQSGDRSPWYQSVGGTSKIFIDMANQASPVLKRSQYKADRPSPNIPKTMLDSLLQEQAVSGELYLNKRESAGIFTRGGDTVLETQSFSLSKGTSEEDAIAQLVRAFKSELSSPEDFSVELLNANFSGTTIQQVWSNYFGLKAQPTRGSGARVKSRQLAGMRTVFATALEEELTNFVTNLLKNVPIQDAGGDVSIDEGFFYDTEVLNVNN